MNVLNETFGAEEEEVAEKSAEKIAAPKKKKSRLHKNTPGDIAIIACLLIFSALTFYPLWYVLIGSVSDGQDYLKGGVYFLPRIFTFESYKTIFANERIWNGLVITLFRCAVGPVSSVLFTSFVAYGMSRKNLRWRKFFNVWALIPMFFGGGLIPYYLLCKMLGLLNTFAIYIIPGMYSVYNMILIRSFFKSTPEELHEAAVLDGAGEFRIYFQLMIPLCMPVLITIFMWSFIGHWNDYLTSMLYCPQRPDLDSLQYVLRQIIAAADAGSFDSVLSVSGKATSETISYAAMTFGALPLIVIFPFVQKYLTQGVYVGSLKG